MTAPAPFHAGRESSPVFAARLGRLRLTGPGASRTIPGRDRPDRPDARRLDRSISRRPIGAMVFACISPLAKLESLLERPMEVRDWRDGIFRPVLGPYHLPAVLG
jgi:hypothetical protein